LLEELRVTLRVRGLAEDGSRFLMRNEFWTAPGEKLVARVTSAGGWLDLEARRLVVPPEALVAALRLPPQTEDFELLPSLRR
jgi:acyl-CoA thioester hydrolase